MTANTQPTGATSLGRFLRDRRARLQPAPGGAARRRTPGLRREEVASRAGVSVTWYTWLEQGRGGPPSNEVLERLVGALELDRAGREILFLLAQHRPPPLAPSPTPDVPGSLQRVLDALTVSPAIVKTTTWDVVAWNAAAVAVLGDYAAVPSHERNVLRRLFGDPAHRAHLPDWEDNARFAAAVFRIDVARAGSGSEALALAAELEATSEDFRRMWAEHDVRTNGVGRKRLDHPTGGRITLEVSTYAVDGADGLTLMIFNPATEADAQAVQTLIAQRRDGRAAPAEGAAGG